MYGLLEEASDEMMAASGVHPGLPDELMDNVRCRLPVSEIIHSNLVCKRWATVSKSSHFLELWREVSGWSPSTSPPWFVDVRRTILGDPWGDPFCKQRLCIRAFDSWKGDHRLVAEVTSQKLETFGLWRCAAVHGLLCIVGSITVGPIWRDSVIFVANPLMKALKKVRRPVFQPATHGRLWRVVTLDMVHNPCQDEFKLLVTGVVTGVDLVKEVYYAKTGRRRDADLQPWVTAVFSSSTNTWHTRLHVRRSFYWSALASLVVGDMWYVVLCPDHHTFTFSARSVQDLLPEQEADWDQLWPPALWQGVRIPPLVLQEWNLVDILSCQGRLLAVALQQPKGHCTIPGPRMFEFLPNAPQDSAPEPEPRWKEVPRLPRELSQRFSRCHQPRLVHCFVYQELIGIVNHENGVGLIFDLCTDSWTIDPVQHVAHGIALPMWPSLQTPFAQPI